MEVVISINSKKDIVFRRLLIAQTFKLVPSKSHSMIEDITVLALADTNVYVPLGINELCKVHLQRQIASGINHLNIVVSSKDETGKSEKHAVIVDDLSNLYRNVYGESAKEAS